MSSLLDLPIELLVLILERVGGRELRRGRGSERLTICRIWYAVALPIYLSGFGTSSIQLYGHNIGKIREMLGYGGLRPLMHKNTRDLRIHLLGHRWDEAIAQADEDGEYATWNELPYDAEENPSLVSKGLEAWRDAQLRPCLDDLFDDLRQFEALENLVVEARSEPVHELVVVPHRNYLYVATISRLISNLPIIHSLSSLTLDSYGTELLGDGHICSMIADAILRIENVRLRMARVCSCILKFRAIRTEDVKLKNLVIKLHSPRSQHSIRSGATTCSALMEKAGADVRLFDDLVRESRSFIAKLDAISSSSSRHDSPALRMRISHIPTTFPCVQVVDCRLMRQYHLLDDWHAHEDDGRPCWFEMEDEMMLVDCGPYFYYR